MVICPYPFKLLYVFERIPLHFIFKLSRLYIFSPFKASIKGLTKCLFICTCGTFNYEMLRQYKIADKCHL